MKKKGFTLIELLAVIVILAIIALIATPLVLKYIEKSRQESKVDSAYSFVRNLETQMANYAIKNNGQRYSSGEKDITKIKDLDTKVKGENPNDGKVCVSNVGQVEKGVFKYENYYVSYDGNKSSIIDEVTYNNFSCGDTNKVVLELGVEFQKYYSKDEFSYSEAILDTSNLSIDKLEVGYEYDLLINDEFVTKVYVIKNNNMIIICSNDNNKLICFFGDDNELLISSEVEFGGTTNIKFTNKNISTDNAFFIIDDEGWVHLVGQNFVQGDAHVLIVDENDVKYFDDNLNFVEKDIEGVYGADSQCRENVHKMPNVYTAITNGKKITVKVSQIVDGREAVTQLNGVYGYAEDYGSAYYLGNFAFAFDTGC